MRYAFVLAVFGFFFVPATGLAQIDPPEDFVLQNPCPIGIASSFPQGGGETICLWNVVDCATGISATMFADCDGTPCSCSGNDCDGDNFLDPAGTNLLGNDPPPGGGGGGGAPGPGVQLDAAATGIAKANTSASSYLLTNLHINQAAGPKKVFCSNKKDLKRVRPLSTKLIPATAGAITDFGKGGYKTKYLKSLKLKVGTVDEYFALYKVFKDEASNTNGEQDLATDSYVGIAMSQPAKAPPGGYESLNSSEAGKVQKLAKFDGGAGSGYVREAVVRIPIQRGTAGTPMTWFHLFGTVM